MLQCHKKRSTILHFGADRIVLILRGWNLNEMGYRVLNASNAIEVIKLATRKRVDAVVLDLDRDHAEVALVATEIKRCRPQVPTILLTEGTVLPDRAHELADAHVPKRDDLGMLAAALENVLAAGVAEPSKAAS